MLKIVIGSGYYEVHTWEDLLTYILELPLEDFEYEWNFRMKILKEDHPEMKDYDWIGDKSEEGYFGNHKRTRYWARRGHYRYVKGQ